MKPFMLAVILGMDKWEAVLCFMAVMGFVAAMAFIVWLDRRYR